MKTIFDLCKPRPDILQGQVTDQDYAADLSAVVKGTAVPEYADPARFFRHTHPTRGLKALLESACRRLSGAGGELSSVIRLHTSYGGGKTHSLIALVHAVRGMQGVQNVEEFIDPALLPNEHVRVAALDGQNADPANGLKLEEGLFARSMWGEMAYRLAGREGYERVRQSDDTHTAPGTDTIVELFGGEPALILIDEVSTYLRKVEKAFPGSSGQFTAFMHALIQAVTSTPKVALVSTLAVGAQDQEARDAYKGEHQRAMETFAEIESIMSRTLQLLDPTAEDETVDVLRRRLFDEVDLKGAADVVKGYCELWDRNRDHLTQDPLSPEVRDQFRKGYPLHPETLNVMTEKMSSLATFQRTRGMLRLLAKTVAHLWSERPADAFAIHPHHMDPAHEDIRGELTTRLEKQDFLPALAADVAAVSGSAPSTAQWIDREYNPGQEPVTSFVARTIFLNTLAYGESAQGISTESLRYSVCSPRVEPSFVEEARKRFAADSLYLDDRPGVPMRFRVEPNLTQIISHTMREVQNDEVKSMLDTKVRDLFKPAGEGFALTAFPAGPYEIDDDAGEARPVLAVLHYDAHDVSDTPQQLPQELERMATTKGVKEEPRILRNNVVFLVADKRLSMQMKDAMRRHLALVALSENAERMKQLAEHQQNKVKEEVQKSKTQVAIAVCQCYRHLFYPSHTPLNPRSPAKLQHTTIELPATSESPGSGQKPIVRVLREQKKLLAGMDTPDAPTFVRDQTPLKTKGEITTFDLRNEYRKAPKLSILLDDTPLIACIMNGIEQETFIYREGNQVWGNGDPTPSIRISMDAFVHTMEDANKKKLWPRPEPEPDPGPTPPPPVDAGGGEPGPPGVGVDTGGGARGTGGATPPVDPPKPDLHAEGPLKQALTNLFDKARQHKVKALKSLTMRLFDPTGAWGCHTAAATYRKAQVECMLEVKFDGEGVTAFEIHFEGSLAKANPVKQFLDNQLRQADGERDFEASYTLCFETPLSTSQASGDEFIQSMTKYAGAEAFVEAEAAPPESEG